MELDQKKKWIRPLGLYPILIILIGIVLLVRCRYGFDWSDETYYTTLAYRLSQGERLFSEMWELHQLSVIPLIPLTKLFLSFSGGSTEGIILFFRSAFVLFEVLVALFSYRVLQSRYQPFAAFVVSALLEVFVHFGLANFSYDSMAVLFLFLSFLCMLQEGGARFSISYFFSGFFYCLAVQCYPQLILSLPLIILNWIVEIKRGAPQTRRPFFSYLSGCGALCLLFCGFVFMNSSFSALFQNMGYLLDDPTHGDVSHLHLILNYFHTLIVVFGPAFYGSLALFLAAIFVFFRRRTAGQKTRQILFLFALLMGLICIARLLAYEIDAVSKLNFLAMSLAPIFPILFVLDHFRLSKAVLLYGLGLAFSVSAQLFSNMGIYASSFPLILSTAATILYCVESPLMDGAYKRLPCILHSAMAGLCLISVFSFRITAMHRESPLPELTAALSSGPAKGVLTTEETALAYSAIVDAVASAASETPQGGTILITSMLPFGYLLTDLKPASPSVWSSPFSERLKTYYGLHPDRLPDLVVTVTAGVGFSSGDGGAAQLFAYLKNTWSRSYTLAEENAFCRVYRVS